MSQLLGHWLHRQVTYPGTSSLLWSVETTTSHLWPQERTLQEMIPQRLCRKEPSHKHVLLDAGPSSFSKQLYYGFSVNVYTNKHSYQMDWTLQVYQKNEISMINNYLKPQYHLLKRLLLFLCRFHIMYHVSFLYFFFWVIKQGFFSALTPKVWLPTCSQLSNV